MAWIFNPFTGKFDNTLTTGDTDLLYLKLDGSNKLAVNVLHTNSYDLTIPATGTAALLATANVFTSGQLVNATGTAFEVRGTGSETAGDLVIDTTNKVVYIGRQSGTALDNSTFQVRNRTGTTYFQLDATPSMTLTNANAVINAGSSQVALTLKANGANLITANNASSVGVFTISNVGATLHQPSTNSTTAFAIKNASGTALLNCDTTNLRVAVGAAKTAKFAVTGHANTTTAWIQAYSSQTSNVPILSVKENTGTPIVEIYKDANGGPSGMMVDIGSQFVTQGTDAGGGISLGLTMNVDFSSLSGQSQASYMGLYQAVYLGDYGMGVNYVGSSVGTTASVSTGFSTVTNPSLTGTVYNASDTSTSGTFSLLRGALFTATGQSSGVTYTELSGAEFLIGTIGDTTKMYGFKISPFIDVSGATKTLTDLYAIGITRWGSTTGYANGNVTNAYGLHIETPQTGGTITNAYGVYIQDMAGTNKWAIKTGTGLVDFGDTVNSTGYLVSGTSGIDATVALAKITAGGTDGSMTVSKGIVTAYTAPT